ncbi:hypothetical protein LJD22_07100 [Bacillus velezensis]|nr:hypothetical protein [Bacillus velezensis]
MKPREIKLCLLWALISIFNLFSSRESEHCSYTAFIVHSRAVHIKGQQVFKKDRLKLCAFTYQTAIVYLKRASIPNDRSTLFVD